MSDSSSSLTIDELIQKHTPRFWLHPNEQFFPFPVEEWFNHCTMNDVVTDEFLYPRDTVLTSSLLDGFVAPVEGRATLKLLPEFDHLKRGTSNLKQVPLYVRVLDDAENDKLYITYIVFFSNNHNYNVFLGAKIGGHYADFERVNFQFNRATQELERVYYGAHGGGDGKWILADNVPLTLDEKRPVVFIAQGSHALYSAAGTYVRFGGVANDLCKHGIKWEPEPAMIQRLYEKGEDGYDATTMGWLNYRGDMGFGRVDDLTSQRGIWSAPGDQTDESAPKLGPNVRPDVVIMTMISLAAVIVIIFLIYMYILWRRRTREAEKLIPAYRRPSFSRTPSRLLSDIRREEQEI